MQNIFTQTTASHFSIQGTKSWAFSMLVDLITT